MMGIAFLVLAGSIGYAIYDYHAPYEHTIIWRGEPVFLKHQPQSK